VYVVEQNGSHADQAIILKRATVQNGPVADTNSASNAAWHVLVHMHRGEILDIGLLANGDWRHVSANDRVVPDGGITTQRDVPEDDGPRGNEGGGVDHRKSSAITAGPGRSREPTR
jgi:hypothetical protein